MTNPTITRREWRNVFLFALVVMALTTLPYLIGASYQRNNTRFGWFLFGLLDANSYLAKMRQGAVDGWLYHNNYTPEPHDGAVLFTPYLAGGKLAALFVPPSNPAFVDAMLWVFHLSRIIFGVILVLVTYRFVAVFLVKRSLRWLAIVLISLGGGLGWFLILIGQPNLLNSAPIDTYLPEGYSLYLFIGLPHLLLARAALLGGFILTFKALQLSSWREWTPLMLLVGLCWLVTGVCVPFYIGVLYTILGVWGLTALLRYRRFPVALFMRCVVGAAVPLPYLIYNFYVFATNPVFAAWSSQNTLPSPHPIHYVFGYGVLAVLALPAIRWAWQRGKHQTLYLLLVGWVIAAPVMAYLPINVQRRMLEAIFVPLCILAVMGLRLWWIGSGVQRRPRYARLLWQQLVAGLLAVMLTTSIMMLVGFTTNNPRLFHTEDEIAALDWLNVNAEPGAVVLSSFETGSYIPARTSLHTFRGHSPETLNLAHKDTLADKFFAGEMSDTERQEFFRQYQIKYVIFDPDMEPLNTAELVNIYDAAGYRIDAVRQK